MAGLQFALWSTVNGGDINYGRYIITQNDINTLTSLSQKCGCWIIFDDERDEISIDIEAWKRKFSEWV